MSHKSKKNVAEISYGSIMKFLNLAIISCGILSVLVFAFSTLSSLDDYAFNLTQPTEQHIVASIAPETITDISHLLVFNDVTPPMDFSNLGNNFNNIQPASGDVTIETFKNTSIYKDNTILE